MFRERDLQPRPGLNRVNIGEIEIVYEVSIMIKMGEYTVCTYLNRKQTGQLFTPNICINFYLIFSFYRLLLIVFSIFAKVPHSFQVCGMSSLERDICKLCHPANKDESWNAYPLLPKRRNIELSVENKSNSQANKKCGLKRKFSLAASIDNTCIEKTEHLLRSKCLDASSKRDRDNSNHSKKMHLDDPTQFFLHPNTTGM